MVHPPNVHFVLFCFVYAQPLPNTKVQRISEKLNLSWQQVLTEGPVPRHVYVPVHQLYHHVVSPPYFVHPSLYLYFLWHAYLFQMSQPQLTIGVQPS